MAKGNNLSPTIDRLGVVKALMADLKAEEAELKAVLVEHGPGAYEGENFRATISMSERATLDMEAVREKLSPQFIAAHTTVSEVVTLRVSARNANKVKVLA
jgi:hypothetical protein